MPRPTSSAKRQQGANTRDTRHEHGLVGPAKRVAKQKSQSQLNGSPKSAATTAAAATVAAAENGAVAHPPLPPLPPPSSITTASTQVASTNGYARQHQHHQNHQNHQHQHPQQHQHDDSSMAPEHKTAESLRRASLGTYSGSSSTDSLAVAPPVPPIAEESQHHRQINVNDAKNTNVHRDPGPFDFALTVLGSCPLQDTLAILIILMQVPPVALATTYMLFTLLTFVPPVTTSSGLSITEIFDGNQGTPSLTTLICMDVIMLGIWLFLWSPMQRFILDLAQVVISLTLGGGGSSGQSTANNVFLCVAIVGVSQWTRHMQWQASLSRLAAIVGPNAFLSPDGDDPLESTLRAFEKKGPYGWIRSILAIHILTQGLVRYIREWYLRRERRDLLSQSQLDPEAGKSTSFAGESSLDGGSGGAGGGLAAADVDASLLLLQQQSGAAGGGTASTKKKRKQSAQVRIRQPLWAALASTKIVMVKEYELSHAASESAGSHATDIHNLGNAPFNTQPGQVWICYIGSDEVCFNTSPFPDRPPEIPSGLSPRRDSDVRSGIDNTKPFYVRVNKAVWQPTRIIPVERKEEEEKVGALAGTGAGAGAGAGVALRTAESGEEEDAFEGTCWTGDIYGLTPLSNYECEFISTQTGEIIFSTSLRTIQAKTKDPEAISKAASSQRLHRHDSPATTLRTSIASAEAKLADEKARLKGVRKDNNRRVNAARKDIEKLSSAVGSAGGNDEKLRQKIAQNKIQEKQAEQCVRDIEAQLKELTAIPGDLLSKHRSHQDAWGTEKLEFDSARASFKSFKAAIDGEIRRLEEEHVSSQAKRNKIATRIAKIDKEHDRINDANAQGMNEAERRHQGRLAYNADMARAEHNLKERLSNLYGVNATKSTQCHDLARRMQDFLAAFQEDLDYDQTVPIPAAAAAAVAAAAAHFPSHPPAGVPVSVPGSVPVSMPASSVAVPAPAPAPAPAPVPVPVPAQHPASVPAPPVTTVPATAPTPAPSALVSTPALATAQPMVHSPWPTSSSHFNPPVMWPVTSMPSQAPTLLPPLPQQQVSPFLTTLQPAIGTPPQQQQQQKTRGRSSSMLSDVSGFTQSDDEHEQEHGYHNRNHHNNNHHNNNHHHHHRQLPPIAPPPGFGHSYFPSVNPDGTFTPSANIFGTPGYGHTHAHAHGHAHGHLHGHPHGPPPGFQHRLSGSGGGGHNGVAMRGSRLGGYININPEAEPAEIASSTSESASSASSGSGATGGSGTGSGSGSGSAPASGRSSVRSGSDGIVGREALAGLA